MNPIIKFIHEMFNPHCQHCQALRIQELEQKEIDREVQIALGVCRACELAQRELATKDRLIKDLLDKLTKKDVSEQPVNQVQNTNTIQTRRPLPSQLRHRLETESKLRAEELRQNLVIESQAPKPNSVAGLLTTEELEKNLGIDNQELGKQDASVNS
jgi:hypothetical protein